MITDLEQVHVHVISKHFDNFLHVVEDLKSVLFMSISLLFYESISTKPYRILFQ